MAVKSKCKKQYAKDVASSQRPSTPAQSDRAKMYQILFLRPLLCPKGDNAIVIKYRDQIKNTSIKLLNSIFTKRFVN